MYAYYVYYSVPEEWGAKLEKKKESMVESP